MGRLPLAIGVAALIAVLGLALAALRDRSQPKDGLRAGRPAPGLVRHEGVDRYPTSTAAALAAYEQASSAVLATGEDFPDGLAAQALAGATGGGSLTALGRLGVTTAVIVGDPAAVSDDVKRSLVASGIAVSRLEGVTRAETALAVARVVNSRTVLLADGSDPAAVSLGPIAYRQGWPVLYWSSDGLSPDSLEFLDGADLRVVLVAAGRDRRIGRGGWTAARPRGGGSAALRRRTAVERSAPDPRGGRLR